MAAPVKPASHQSEKVNEREQPEQLHQQKIIAQDRKLFVAIRALLPKLPSLTLLFEQNCRDLIADGDWQRFDDNYQYWQQLWQYEIRDKLPAGKPEYSSSTVPLRLERLRQLIVDIENIAQAPASLPGAKPPENQTALSAFCCSTMQRVGRAQSNNRPTALEGQISCFSFIDLGVGQAHKIQTEERVLAWKYPGIFSK